MKVKFITTALMALALRSFAQTEPAPTPQWRPVYHFTPDKFWTNDPNGLFYLNGKFQLYYQHNPFENKWGHMSWGHAESTDLVHWKHLPVAIPEVVTKDTTTWIYSGSAVVDKNNTSGFGKNGKSPIIAIFTGDQPKQHKESQFIAYSNDNGMSYKLYDKDPVIDLHKPDFRDPNVFWYAPKKQWVMTVSLVSEHKIRFYGSKNLKDWVKLSDFGPAGNIKSDWECPSLVPLVVDGNPANIKYVLFVSNFGEHGPQMQYFVGDFNGTTFKNINPNDKALLVDHGDCFYAAISWRDAPQNKKIFLGWLVNGKPETYPWKGQMAIPRDLSFRTTPEGIRLVQTPTTVITNNIAKYTKGAPLVKTGLQLNKALQLSSTGRFEGNSYWISATIKPGTSGKTEFWVASTADGSQQIKVGYDAAAQQIYVDCTATEGANKDPKNLVQTAPARLIKGQVKLNILLDKSSLEVFGDDGESVISTMVYPAAGNNKLFVTGDGSSTISKLSVWDMDK